MKGIYLTGPNQFSLQELDEPVPGKKDVLIKVRMAGICGSDLHLLRGRNPFAAYPLVPGHEYMGEVLKAPKNSGLRRGEKVTAFPEVGCGKCPACKEGRLVHCPEFKFVGVRVPGGCFCEKLVVPRRRVIKLPRRMKDEEGAMVEPTAVAVHAVQEDVRCRPVVGSCDQGILEYAAPFDLLHDLLAYIRVGILVSEELVHADEHQPGQLADLESEPLPLERGM